MTVNHGVLGSSPRGGAKPPKGGFFYVKKSDGVDLKDSYGILFNSASDKKTDTPMLTDYGREV